MKKRDFTANYAFVQGAFWMCYASVMGFVSLYLLDAGLDNSRVGLLIAAAGLLSALGQPVAAAYADRPGSISLRNLLRLSAAVTLLCTCGLLCVRGSIPLTGLMYMLCMILLQMTTPFVNSLGVETLNSGEKLNFGIARGLGSLGYAAGAWVIGALADRFGAAAVPASMMIIYALLLLSALIYPQTRRTDLRNVSSGKSERSFLARYPRYTLILAGCTLIFVSHVVLNNFTYQIVVSKGGSSAEMGTGMALASALELPTMFGFSYMLKKARCDFWFRISGIFFTLKCLFTLLCTDMAGFYAVQLFQPLGWGLITVSSVYYISAIMAPEDAVKGQACYTVSMTLGNVLGALVCGRILDALGVQAMLLFGTGAGLAGALILLIFSQNTGKAKP